MIERGNSMTEYERQILAFRSNMEENIQNTIQGEYVKIGKEIFHFRETELYPKKNYALIPIEFIDLPEEIAKQQFISADYPPIVKTSLNLKVQFTFEWHTDRVFPNQIPNITQNAYNMVIRLFPGNTFLGIEFPYVGQRQFGLYQYQNPTMGENIVTTVALTAFEGRLFQASSICVETEYEKWKPIIRQVLLSVYEI